MLERIGFPAVRGRVGVGVGFYGRWAFLRVSKITFRNVVWFSFRLLSAVYSVWM